VTPRVAQLPTTAPRRQRHRPLVDVADREAAPPRRISIPAIGVRARVVSLQRSPDGTMETPENFDNAGWYQPGSEPGERGPAVIAGHVDSTSGPAVFYRLRELKRGNLVRISRADGSVVRFRVEGLERWPKAAFPTRRVFGGTRLAALRLVTCSGNFDASTGHYVDNTIVYATRLPVRRRVLARPAG
jgi:Sortase domain